jgi:hypothetical protein
LMLSAPWQLLVQSCGGKIRPTKNIRTLLRGVGERHAEQSRCTVSNRASAGLTTSKTKRTVMESVLQIIDSRWSSSGWQYFNVVAARSKFLRESTRAPQEEDCWIHE